MREFKFRVWDKQQHKFHTNKDWGISLDGANIIGFSSHDSWPDDRGYKITLTENLVVLQYTGLQDKNGKDIYDGDILFFVQQDGVWSNQVNRCIEVKYPFVCSNAHLAEVIGNIFENPELLK
jgi:uncharacterized phage protein (TIGR01671 family)